MIATDELTPDMKGLRQALGLRLIAMARAAAPAWQAETSRERGGPTVGTNEDNVLHDQDPPERPLTMQDIARASGVSQSTVSRVLNDDPAVKPQTRDSVLATITALKQICNHPAQLLKDADFRLPVDTYLGARFRDAGLVTITGSRVTSPMNSAVNRLAGRA